MSKQYFTPTISIIKIIAFGLFLLSCKTQIQYNQLIGEYKAHMPNRLVRMYNYRFKKETFSLSGHLILSADSQFNYKNSCTHRYYGKVQQRQDTLYLLTSRCEYRDSIELSVPDDGSWDYKLLIKGDLLEQVFPIDSITINGKRLRGRTIVNKI